MKSYWSQNEVRLSGKAWQVRHFLKHWVREAEPGLLLTDWLNQQTAVSGSLTKKTNTSHVDSVSNVQVS